MSALEFSMLAKSLVSESTRIEANGSGWCCNYIASLYRPAMDTMLNYFKSFSHSDSVPTHPGFLVCYQTFNFLDAIYLKQHCTLKSKPLNYIHLPPFSFHHLRNLNNLVDTVLTNSGVPTTDRNSLAGLLFFMLNSHDQISTTECVPLFLEFNKITVLRTEAEAADWLCGGTMDSIIVTTLRATHDVIKKLERSSFNRSLCKTETCMVCLEGFEGDGDERVSRLPCSHEFHHDCIVKWLKCNHRCPICRYPMDWVHLKEM